MPKPAWLKTESDVAGGGTIHPRGVPYAAAFGYNGAMTKEQINAVLDSVRSWPQEDQEELVEVAREIEARRRGVYVLTQEERAALAEARDSGLASDDEADAFWKRHGVT